MKKLISVTLVSLLTLVQFAPFAHCADSYLIYIKRDTQDKIKVKLIDNGDGTFSFANVSGAASLAGLGYWIYADRYSAAPDSLTGGGVGLGWAVEAVGGDVTFNVNSSSNMYVLSGKSVSGKFDQTASTPIINLVSLDANATAQFFLEVAR